MWFIGVEVEQETSAAPPKKILDPPLTSPFLNLTNCNQRSLMLLLQIWELYKLSKLEEIVFWSFSCQGTRRSSSFASGLLFWILDILGATCDL